MSNTPSCPFAVGDIIKITQWTEDKPNVKTVLVQVVRVIIPEMILVKYVKVWTSEKVQKGEGRISAYDIKKYEMVSEEQFNMMWSLS